MFSEMRSKCHIKKRGVGEMRVLRAEIRQNRSTAFTLVLFCKSEHFFIFIQFFPLTKTIIFKRTIIISIINLIPLFILIIEVVICEYIL